MTEPGVRVESSALHAQLAALGCPVGRLNDGWTAEPMLWLFELPAWQRAQFLSAFASAGATSPSLVDGRIADVAIEHAGTSRHVIDLIARLCESLGFRVGISVGGPVRGGTATYVLQVLGGEADQLRFFEQVGFCRAYEKRVAAARVASVAWRSGAARSDPVLVEGAAVARARSPHPGLRRPKGASSAGDHSGEVAWVPVRSVLPSGPVAVYDVATGDEAASFIGEGICVHNCGNKAVRTDLMAADVDVPAVMDEIVGRISFGVGRANDEPVDHPVLDEIRGAAFAPQRKLYDMAAAQLGTVGSGNHYCDLFADEDGRLWIGVHFGSRGFGHRTASGFLALAKGWAFDAKAPEDGMDSPPVLFADDSEIGQGYIAAMELAGRYAYAGRDVVVDRILRILGARAVEEVHNHHNYLWRERHFGQDAWVVRKGCTPAFPGQPGFVGASMGEDAVILEGVESPAGADLLYSTVHGAGRVMSRTQAAGKVRWKRTWACPVGGCTERNEQARIATKKPPRCPRHGQVMVKKRIAERVRPGLIDWDATRASLRAQDIELRGGGADEAPAAYKRLDDVLAAHADTVRIRHRLRPIGVAMAGADVYDPYKD